MSRVVMRWFCPRESRQALSGHLGAFFWGWTHPCRARLPGKGGPSPDGILFLWLAFGPLDLHVDSSELLVSCTLTWVGASILLPCMCIVWAIDPGFVAPTEVPGPAPNAVPSVVAVRPNKYTGGGAEEAGLLRSSFLLH